MRPRKSIKIHCPGIFTGASPEAGVRDQSPQGVLGFLLLFRRATPGPRSLSENPWLRRVSVTTGHAIAKASSSLTR